MTQSNKTTPNTQPTSTVTKYIKIYSDNPIHDCIDRIIDACSCIDQGGDNLCDHLVELQEAAEELDRLAQRKICANCPW